VVVTIDRRWHNRFSSGPAYLAIAQLADMRDNADMIANLDPFGPPLIADMDTGYGGMYTCPEGFVQETAQELS
jgi:isocitrate lyase